MSRSYHITRKSAKARAAIGDDSAISELFEKQIVKQQARKHGHDIANRALVRIVRTVKKGDDNVA